MSSNQPLKMQPTFTVNVSLQPEQLMPRIKRAIADLGFSDVIASAGACVDLHIEKDQQRFWSPHLNVQVSSDDGGSELFGRYSPRPEIWTMFMAIYFMASFVGFVGAIHGYVQWFLGDFPWSLILFPLSVAVVACLHLASLIGQQLSADQMERLRERLDQVVEQATEAKEQEGEAKEQEGEAKEQGSEGKEPGSGAKEQASGTGTASEIPGPDTVS